MLGESVPRTRLNILDMVSRWARLGALWAWLGRHFLCSLVWCVGSDTVGKTGWLWECSSWSQWCGYLAKLATFSSEEFTLRSAVATSWGCIFFWWLWVNRNVFTHHYSGLHLQTFGWHSKFLHGCPITYYSYIQWLHKSLLCRSISECTNISVVQLTEGCSG